MEWVVGVAVIVAVVTPLLPLSDPFRSETALQVCRVANAADDCGPAGPGGDSPGVGSDDGGDVTPIVFEIDPLEDLQVELTHDPDCDAYENPDTGETCSLWSTEVIDPTIEFDPDGDPLVDPVDPNTPIDYGEPLCEPTVSNGVDTSLLYDIQLFDRTPTEAPSRLVTRLKIGTGSSFSVIENPDGTASILFGANVALGGGGTGEAMPDLGEGWGSEAADRLLRLLGWAGYFDTHLGTLAASGVWDFDSVADATAFAAQVLANNSADTDALIAEAEALLGPGADAEMIDAVVEFLSYYEGLTQLTSALETRPADDVAMSLSRSHSRYFLAAVNTLGIGMAGAGWQQGLGVSVAGYGTDDEVTSITLTPFGANADAIGGLALSDFYPEAVRDALDLSVAAGLGTSISVSLNYESGGLSLDGIIADGMPATTASVSFSALTRNGELIDPSAIMGGWEANYYEMEWLMEQGISVTDYTMTVPVDTLPSAITDPAGFADSISMTITESDQTIADDAYYEGVQIGLGGMFEHLLGHTGVGTTSLFVQTHTIFNSSETLSIEMPISEWIAVDALGLGIGNVADERWNLYRVCP